LAPNLAKADETAFGASAYDILELLGLSSLAGEIAKNLPHGHLRALGIAVGLATDPSILLLDEPFRRDEPRRDDEDGGNGQGACANAA